MHEFARLNIQKIPIAGTTKITSMAPTTTAYTIDRSNRESEFLSIKAFSLEQTDHLLSLIHPKYMSNASI